MVSSGRFRSFSAPDLGRSLTVHIIPTFTGKGRFDYLLVLQHINDLTFMGINQDFVAGLRDKSKASQAIIRNKLTLVHDNAIILGYLEVEVGSLDYLTVRTLEFMLTHMLNNRYQINHSNQKIKTAGHLIRLSKFNVNPASSRCQEELEQNTK